MNSDGVSVWLQKQLKPLSKGLERVSPDVFAWLSLLFSASAGVLLYFSQIQFYPMAALAAALLLLLRLLTVSLEEMLSASQTKTGNYLLARLCARLADLSMLLGFAFWDSIRIHLVLCALVSMLLVSYVAELGRTLGASDCSGGLLSKSNRIILLIFFSVVYVLKPNAGIADYTVFEVMFALFIPLASLTLLQRMDSIIHDKVRKDD